MRYDPHRKPVLTLTSGPVDAYPEVLGGDQAKQIEAVTQYLMTLGQGAAASSAPPARATTAGQATSAGGPSR